MDIFERHKSGNRAKAHYSTGRSGIFGLQSAEQVPAWEKFQRGLKDFMTRTGAVERALQALPAEAEPAADPDLMSVLLDTEAAAGLDEQARAA